MPINSTKRRFEEDLQVAKRFHSDSELSDVSLADSDLSGDEFNFDLSCPDLEIPEVPSAGATPPELDIEDDLGDCELERWPLEPAPEALTFSVLNAPKPEAPAALAEAAEAFTDDTEPEDCDQFIDYASCSEEPMLAQYSAKPRYFYRKPALQLQKEPDARAVLAAWSSVAPGVDQARSASYLAHVLLAAAGLTHTAMASGRARQTMAPAFFEI